MPTTTRCSAAVAQTSCWVGREGTGSLAVTGATSSSAAKSRDFAFGSFGQDIVIGGTTAHDGDLAALLAILDEWTSDDPFDVRVQRLTDGTGGLPALNDTTVMDDGVREFLFGGPGQDWVFDESAV